MILKTLSLKSLDLTPEMRALVERRIEPFIKASESGITNKLLFEEAYLRGLHDALNVFNKLRKEEGR